MRVAVVEAAAGMSAGGGGVLESVRCAVSVYWGGVEELIGRTRIPLLSMIVIQAARHWAAVDPAKSCFTTCYSVNVHWLLPHPSAAVVILGSEKRRSCMRRPCPEDQSQCSLAPIATQ